MTSTADSANEIDSEHVVGKVLAAEPPILVSALLLAVGIGLAVIAMAHMRHKPHSTILQRLRLARHA
ncbi:MAG: hypothetical protein Q7L55_05690 [Actinomycetota bacterium]|nr:hypothetical protein [Actinomycetota bacterium]